MAEQKKTRSWGHRLREENKALKKKVADFKRENARLKNDVEKAWELMAHVPGGIFLLQQETIAYANEAASRWLGYGFGELNGKTLRDIIDREELATIIDFIQGKAGIQTPDVLRFKNSEGRPVLCAVHIKKTRYEGRNALLLNLIEIDRKIETEKARLEAGRFEALRKLAGALTREFESVSEDETPLLEALNTFARGPYHSSELSPLNLNELIATSVAAYCSKNGIQYGKKSHIKNQSVLISALNTASPINGSRKDLQTAFLGLVANAAEALEEPGEIYMTAQEEPGAIDVYVQENGRGVREDAADHIYDPFFSTKGSEHRGLGLSVARAVIERHGGKISMVNHEAGGTTFHVRLPLRFAPKTEISSPQKSLTDAKILLVGDQNILITLLRRFLRSKRLNVQQMDRYDESLKALTNDSFDLLLLDHDKNPSRIKWFIGKARHSQPDTPIALFNAPKPGAPGMSRNRQIDLILPKPIHVEQSYKRIARLIRENKVS